MVNDKFNLGYDTVDNHREGGRLDGNVTRAQQAETKTRLLIYNMYTDRRRATATRSSGTPCHERYPD